MSEAPTDAAQAFIASLYALVAREDRAALAALRRGLGKRPGQVAEMFPYVVPYCSQMSASRQNDYFLVAALFAIHQGLSGASDRYRNNLGASYRTLRAATDSRSIEQRFVALLNADREDLDAHLRHTISLMKAHDINVDWAQLLRDLHGWEWESRSIQRRWSQAYWGERHGTDQTAVPSTNTQAAPRVP